VTRRRKTKHRSNKQSELTGCVFIILLLAILAAFKPAISVFVLACFLTIMLYQTWRRLARLRSLQLDDIDTMPGHQFEQYVARLMQEQGYSTTVTKGSGDLGVDIIAQKNGVRYAVQCKRYGSNIPRTAISDAVAGKQHYKCTQAMVVTNQYFTQGATELARSTQCILIDRALLASWVRQFRRE
jgi:restriction system protein